MFIPKTDRFLVHKEYQGSYTVQWEGEIVARFKTASNCKSWAKKMSHAMSMLTHATWLDGELLSESVAEWITNAQQPDYGFDPLLPG